MVSFVQFRYYRNPFWLRYMVTWLHGLQIFSLIPFSLLIGLNSPTCLSLLLLLTLLLVSSKNNNIAKTDIKQIITYIFF